MFAKHFTVFLHFTSYFSFTAQLGTKTRAAKIFSAALIVFGLIGVGFAILAACGKLVFFDSLAAQKGVAKNIALYNLMTLLLLPAVTDLKVTLPSGEAMNIGPWFYQTSACIIRPAAPQGFLYLAVIFAFTVLASLGFIINVATGQFVLSELSVIIIIALGVMMYIYALNQCRQDNTHDKPPH